MRSVTMLDLKAEYALFRDEIRAVVEETLDGQQFIGGPAIGQLERDMQDRFGFHNAIAVSSGTDAILCTLMALGVGAGDEVVLPAFTFLRPPERSPASARNRYSWTSTQVRST